MRKLLFVLGLIFTLNVNAGSVVKSWNCNGLVVSLCDDNKMCVGEMEYDIVNNGNVMFLVFDGRPMLYVITNTNDTITIFNYDNKSDRKTFVRCF